MSFKVAIVGRPNVGKSTLFNRLVDKRIAITDDKSGTTRDRLYGTVNWLSKQFSVIDTGGLDFKSTTFSELIKNQVELAILEADLILFLTDAYDGLLADDEEIKKLLLKRKKTVLCVVNKVDSNDFLEKTYDFYSLGFDDVVCISAYHGRGIGDLLDKIISYMVETDSIDNESKIPFCIIGRPNVGKSSLTNAILGFERVIVSEVPGTTLDPTHTFFERDNKEYVVVDTAGIRKTSKFEEALEKYSLFRTIDVVEQSDVCLLVIDGSVGVQEQDKHVCSYITDANKAIVIIVNKWDLVEKETNTMKEMEDKIRDEFKFLSYAEIVFLSSLENKRIDKIFGPIDRAYENFHKKIKTSIINEILNDAILFTPPQPFNQKKAKFYYALQVGTCPPKISIYVNEPLSVHFSYERYLINQFNKSIDFTGTPLLLFFERKITTD
ncbi:MAG: ribosome biogenesis GTPase Der [Acholeplasmatales bacterium]|jgi:GTP-binding protein|nr:ribosome biogenesis GTPase Der [Acholeplasmatales bacterium]